MRDDIVSHNMIKMEKNFIAHNEKGYERYPYECYPIYNDEDPRMSLIGFINREVAELNEAVEDMTFGRPGFDLRQLIIDARKEIGDVSNTLDYLDEALLRMLVEL